MSDENYKWNELEQEDYKFYLDNINKITIKDNEFDALSILEGDIPKLNSQIDKYKCAVIVGKLLNIADIRLDRHDDYRVNLTRLGNQLDLVHKILLFKQLNDLQAKSFLNTKEGALWLNDISENL